MVEVHYCCSSVCRCATRVAPDLRIYRTFGGGGRALLGSCIHMNSHFPCMQPNSTNPHRVVLFRFLGMPRRKAGPNKPKGASVRRKHQKNTEICQNSVKQDNLDYRPALCTQAHPCALNNVHPCDTSEQN